MSSLSEIIKLLQQKNDECRAQDPLLRRGIDSDWVCVVAPWMENALRQRYDELYTHSYAPHNALRLDTVTGRKTYIEASAKSDIQYMAQSEYDKVFSIED